ncbi:imidazoleglycerol-phosphate dehydratase HisB [bacterium]|nr:imidazoleglycerol-phosphate dehydratase HisB [bacterium]
MPRTAKVQRKTSETDITLQIDLDGKGVYKIDTGIPFFDHMLSLFSRHSFFDIELMAKGDIEIDFHHTVEDVGIIFGQGLRTALGEKKGIVRYGMATVPMDETLASVAVDICSRAVLVFNCPSKERYYVGGFDLSITEEFFRAFAANSQITIHLNLLYGKNLHHIIEALFKAAGRSLKQACAIDPGIEGVLSTKGIL